MRQADHSSARHGSARGFTLIELMIVVALVAILASAAYPAYVESVRKGWRAQARTALMQEMQQQERHYTRRARYRTAEFATATSPDDAASSKYDIAIAACEGRDDAGQCIRLTARLKSGFSDPVAGQIWIESSGRKGCTGSDPGRCWQ